MHTEALKGHQPRCRFLASLYVRHRVARPLKTINWDLVNEYCAVQCTQIEIASRLGISVDTLERACNREKLTSFADYFGQKRQVGFLGLRSKQFEVALAGNVTMLIWLGKIGNDTVNHSENLRSIVSHGLAGSKSFAQTRPESQPSGYGDRKLKRRADKNTHSTYCRHYSRRDAGTSHAPAPRPEQSSRPNRDQRFQSEMGKNGYKWISVPTRPGTSLSRNEILNVIAEIDVQEALEGN